MVALLSKHPLKLDFPSLQIKSVNQIHSNIDVLLIDYDKIDFDAIEKLYVYNPKIRILAIDDGYVRANALKCYSAMLHHYLFDMSILQEELNFILARFHKQNNLMSEIKLNSISREANFNGVVIKLPKSEFLILNYLNDNIGLICLKDDILVNILGYHAESETRLVSVYVRYLRKKIENTDYEIITKRGEGYILRSKKS